MRLIDADALIDKTDDRYSLHEIGRREHDDIVDALEYAPTIQPEPHWIPVTERLPKSKEEDLEYPTVLICFENEEVMLGCFYESTKEWGTGKYFDKKCNPIAWMPKPEPYKGVTE